MPWQWRTMQNLKRNWLVISKLTWQIWLFLTRALESLKNFHFNVLLLSKVYIVWAKKVQGSYLSWNWGVIQILKKNWLVVWKKTWEIWQIFTTALESVKNWDFDGILLSKVEKVWPENLQRMYVPWQWGIMQNLKRNWVFIRKLTWGV